MKTETAQPVALGTLVSMIVIILLEKEGPSLVVLIVLEAHEHLSLGRATSNKCSATWFCGSVWYTVMAVVCPGGATSQGSCESHLVVSSQELLWAVSGLGYLSRGGSYSHLKGSEMGVDRELRPACFLSKL